jgi:hypothetical protein
MIAMIQKSRAAFASLALLTGLLAGCSGMQMMGQSQKLSGDQEVPPVMTNATGSGSITIGSNMSVTGGVTVSGMTGTAAHIHMAAAGKNGPVIVPFTKTADNVWSVPVGTVLNAAQYAAYQAGELYVNVHSDAYKGGEIRAQLKP